MKLLYTATTITEALNMGNASRASDTVTRFLASVLFISINTRVIMMSKIIQYHGLFKVSNRFVSDIVYKHGGFAPALPKYIWVELNYQYKGPTFFPNEIFDVIGFQSIQIQTFGRLNQIQLVGMRISVI